MGSHSTYHVFDGALTPTALKEAFVRYQDQLTNEYGTDPYNGTLATCRGLRVETARTFPTQQEAADYVFDNTHKWDAALAVKYIDRRTARPDITIGGQKVWDACGYRTTTDWTTRITAFHAADKFTKVEAAKLEKLWRAEEAMEQAVRAHTHALQQLLARVTKGPLIDAAWSKEVKTRQRALLAATPKHLAASQALVTYRTQLIDAHYPEVTTDHGTHWFVGGWAAC